MKSLKERTYLEIGNVSVMGTPSLGSFPGHAARRVEVGLVPEDEEGKRRAVLRAERKLGNLRFHEQMFMK